MSKTTNKINEFIDKIIAENLDSIMADRFSRYSKYIIQQRALPDVRDGLKPVQRRILFSMFNLGLQFNKPYKKSARVVGDVIGKYHPHGDSSIYEALVRMAQDWKMGHTLVEMHGNIGSIDDDPAAAMRYTEARLAKISELVLGDIKKNTVKFAPNFDDSEIEPVVLPSMIPNLLINGAKGIASGFATEMPPHNLGEVLDGAIAKIKNPALTLEKLMKIIKGPDFPTGGVIYGSKGIYESFERGRGRITLASKYRTFKDNKNKFIEILEIPYGVIKNKLVHDIDTKISTNSINGLLEIKDQSDRNGISILITCEKDANTDAILNYLFQKTELKIYYSYNNVAILENSPRLLSLQNLLDEYIKHIKDVKKKTLLFDLAKYETRLEIVDGFIKVSEITDAVIKVIRESYDSKNGVIQNLIKSFDFTLNQATAIAELRLYKLSRTDKEAFLLEKEELLKNIALCKLYLNDEGEFNKFLISILSEIKREFATPRKTEILDEEMHIKIEESELIKSEVAYVSVTKSGYLKRFNKKTYDSNSLINFGIKEDDQLIYFAENNTINQLLLFTNFGNYAQIPVYKIPESKWKENGLHISSLVAMEPGEEFVSVVNVTDFKINNYIILMSSKGQAKRTLLSDFEVQRANKTFTAIGLKKGDTLVSAKISNGYKDIFVISEKGLASLYPETEIQVYGTKSNGTISSGIASSDKVSAFVPVNNDDEIVMLANNKFLKRLKVNQVIKIGRKNRGKPVFMSNKFNQMIINEVVANNSVAQLFSINDANDIYNEKIADYPLTTKEEGFKKAKKSDTIQMFLFANMSTDNQETKVEEVSYEKPTQSEERILEENKKTTESILDLDIDSILAKFKK
ncbi:DNA topoisomerase IV subunit A [Mycoplasmopsis opalescens]|uniref:DNA topoisomerase IV subunit A n=1 Tax=Mycoplasmopsis opalescens TaxID=114886 RepID=UPI0004A762E4|nr:DNA topoisomerase IV subunit A [Mycoplasmopsis opalescens]